MVRGPMRPINIVIIITIFEGKDSSAVIPRLKPTVPKAETTSNNNSINLNFVSKDSKSKKETEISINEIIITKKAFSSR